MMINELTMDEVLGVDIQLDIARKKYAELLRENRPEANDDKIVILKSFVDSIVQFQKEEQQKIQQQQIQMMMQAKGQGGLGGGGGQPPPNPNQELLDQQ